ncbi:MAG TPA: WcbI family polysaccharide biosynthesis putative acetyltransferase [Stellaceae bacterium]|nr:WcbI family polysaccharide biosynthesis putative acetyltransferase [Stellaceae bacterium]
MEADAISAAPPGAGGPALSSEPQGLLSFLEKGAIGRRHGDRVSVRRSERIGCLLYGPYWRLPAGCYRLRFHCEAGEPRSAADPVLGVDVIALGRFQQAWRDFTAAELRPGPCALDFIVPQGLAIDAEDEARFEFRFFHLGNADLVVTMVELRRIEAQEVQPASREWRLFGRLETRAIGRRRAGQVTVRRHERAALLLAGMRPPLILPQGHYRLDFRCRVRRPIRAREPVLGVEVVARRRWGERERRGWEALFALRSAPVVQQAWRDFTAAEIEAGAGSIDFAVAAAFALESGQDVVFEVRFLHFGNADLTLGAVVLRRLDEREIAPAATPEWRLLGRLRRGPMGPLRAGLAIGRNGRARPIFGGIRPALSLPAGRYRLQVTCRAGTPRVPERPILETAIVAHTRTGRWSWDRQQRERRSFAAADLRGGSATLDFEVPPQLGLESGSGARVAFEFTDTGNAELTIAAVTVRAAPCGRPPAPALLGGRNRTNVVVVGNCQALAIQRALSRAAALNARLDVKYHFVALQKSLHDQGRQELGACDVVLVQDIRDWENYPLRDAIPERASIIKFPLLHFASLWPFDHYTGLADREAFAREAPNLTFPYLDGLLGRLRREIPDKEERFLAYRELAVDRVVNCVRLHDFERRRLIALDRKFGFDIGRLILDRFRHQQLFYTIAHPNHRILTMLTRYVLQKMGVAERYRPLASLDHLERVQVPVHPKVAKALGVRWAHEKTRYAYGGRTVTWEHYIRSYIDHYG